MATLIDHNVEATTPAERIGAALIGYSEGNPLFLQGLRLALLLAKDGGEAYIAPDWLRRYRQSIGTP